MSEKMSKLFYSKAEACTAIGISIFTLDKLLHRKVNPIPFIKTERLVLIPVDGLNRWIEQETARQQGTDE